MANKLMEELHVLKTQYETLQQEEIAKIIDFISKEKITMTSTKYLTDNFEKVKSKTVADFWIELANKIQNRFDCKIKFIPRIENILDFETFEENLSENKIFELHLILDLYHQVSKGIRIGTKDINEADDIQILKPLEIFIGYELGNWMYLGVKKDLIDEERSSAMENSERINLFKYNAEKREWRRDIFSERAEKIKLSDFSHQATFDLIDKQKREVKIIQIVEEIVYYLKRYNGIIIENLN